jgi:release factor glutamine methyltransferase
VTLAEAVRRLSEAGVPDPQRDARRLHDWALRQGPDAQAAERFAGAIDRRAARVPVSRIMGTRAFWRHDFAISDDVLDPRPDTETLVELALAAPFDRVLDLGTGSGCILLSLLSERPGASGTGTDISDAALATARQNAARLGVEGATFLRSDWFADVTGRYDLIVSNPPYISEADYAALAPEVLHDPRLALTPGGDGLSPYRAIAARAPSHLTSGGRLMVEIGHDQGSAVAALFQAAGLVEVTVHPDINGKDRVVAARHA